MLLIYKIFESTLNQVFKIVFRLTWPISKVLTEMFMVGRSIRV